MNRAAICLGLILGVATAATWDDVAFTRDGKWSLLSGSVGMSIFNGRAALIAAATHTKDGAETVYSVFVDPAHCQASYGETVLTTLDGSRIVASIVWTRGRQSVGEALAVAICAAQRRKAEQSGRPGG